MDLSGATAVVLGIGDDCALLGPQVHEELAITSDMLVEGRHFFRDANPEWLGLQGPCGQPLRLGSNGSQASGLHACACPAAC